MFTDFVDGGAYGTTLRDWMDADALTFKQITGFAHQFACGMEYLSSRGAIAHLDLKPGNLLITAEGILKVADFGLARRVAPFVTRPATEARGTLAYMAPEHLAGCVVDERADVYSFGVSCFSATQR